MAKKKPARKLFDPAAAAGASAKADAGSFRAEGDSKTGGTLSVSALVKKIRGALEEAFPTRVTVVGEISNLSMPASGHVYFSLKDAKASIPAAMWKGRASKLAFRPEAGMEVVAEGSLTIYGPQGRLQLSIERLSPRGAGVLELAYRQLVETLRGEGLFAPEHKKAIPKFPRAIGLITSATGAAVRDIQRTLSRRWPSAAVYLLPVIVQGESAGAKIAQAVADLDAAADALGLDTLVLARGGGSIEDLWCFNDESLARAIFAAATPIIAGVGHEVDTTIAELVADLRAATPTAAAELVAPDAAEWREQLGDIARRLNLATGRKLEQSRSAIESLARSAAMRDPMWRVSQSAQQLDELDYRARTALSNLTAQAGRKLAPLYERLVAQRPSEKLERFRRHLAQQESRLAWSLGARSKSAGDRLAALLARLLAVNPAGRLAMARQRLEALGKQMDVMSHQSVLRRGFSITRNAAGRVVRSVADVAPGQSIETLLADGELRSVVAHGARGKRPDPSAPKRPKQPKKPKKKPPPESPGLFDLPQNDDPPA